MGLDQIVWELGEDDESSFHGLTTVDDIEAIQVYFISTNSITPEAAKIKDEFTKWYDNLWWYEKTLQSNFDLARNLRNRFNLANVKSIDEKKQIEEQIKTGISAEQMKGEPDRRLSTGMLPGPTKPPEKPWYLHPIAIAGGAVGAIALVSAAFGAGKGITS